MTMKLYTVLTLFALCYFASSAKLDKEFLEPKEPLKPRQNVTISGDNPQMVQIKGRKYVLTPRPESWNGARKACIRMGGHLATIWSYGTGIDLRDAFLKGKDQLRDAWIGFHDRFTVNNNRLFVTVLDEEVDARFGDLFWAPGEPNNADGNENCVELTQIGLNDHKCWKSFHGICEF